MTSARTRQALTSAAVAVLCLSAVAFAALVIFPGVQDTLSSYRTAEDELETLNSRVTADVMPTRGAIDQYAQLKTSMVEEVERSASFFLRQNQSLDQRILESWRMDAYQLAINFRELKSKLAEKAGNPDFLELGRLDDWEKRAGGKPQKENFAALEKKACIASALTDGLTQDPNTVIELMQIEEPVEPETLPPVPDVDWMLIRYRIYPVDVSFTTRFSTLGKTLHRLVTIPPAASNLPCMGVRNITVLSEKNTAPERVRVELGLNVFDFYEPNQEG